MNLIILITWAILIVSFVAVMVSFLSLFFDDKEDFKDYYQWLNEHEKEIDRSIKETTPKEQTHLIKVEMDK